MCYPCIGTQIANACAHKSLSIHLGTGTTSSCPSVLGFSPRAEAAIALSSAGTVCMHIDIRVYTSHGWILSHAAVVLKGQKL